MKLYSYWRLTTSFRARDGQNGDDYYSMNPNAGVPTPILNDVIARLPNIATVQPDAAVIQ